MFSCHACAPTAIGMMPASLSFGACATNSAQSFGGVRPAAAKAAGEYHMKFWVSNATGMA